MKWTISTLLIAAAAVLVPARSFASSGIVTEAVDTGYGTGTCLGPPLQNRVQNATQFRNQLLLDPRWTSGADYTNASVWDTDFFDPDLGTPGDDDTHNFDPLGAAISYYSGHGICTSQASPPQSCSRAADCTNPPSGVSAAYARCVVQQVGVRSSAICRYSNDVQLYVCGSRDAHNHYVDVSSGNIAWGESSYSGGWRGAGTNGGTNLVVLDASCATNPASGAQLFNAYAGIHLLATTMNITGDVADVGDRGVSFAKLYAVNPTGSVASAWAESLNSVGGTLHGYNGLGANYVQSLDVSLADATWKTEQENWIGLTDDRHDATGSGFWSATWQCNYDCINNPITL
jgi:hypothetical protein